MSIFRSVLLLAALSVVAARAQTGLPTVSRVIPPQTLTPGGAPTAVNLADYFSLSGVTGQLVQFDTVLGKFDVELRPDVAPQHVANFLGYVARGDYTNSFFHRSATFDAGAISIVQGGGYAVVGTQVVAVPAQPPVPLEYNLPNERGTLAAARTVDINSATSQWFFNVRDNSSILGPSNGGGYTVFGRVLGSGMTVIDAIAALQRIDARGGDQNSPFGELPVRNYTGNLQVSNLALVNSITAVPVFPSGDATGIIHFTIDNSAPGVVTAALSGSILTLTPGAAGSATITVHAIDVSGNAVETSFVVTVTISLPSFATQPTSQTVASGNTVVLSATANAAVSYQWQRNGADVFGATNATLVLNNATSANAGSYTLVARNPLGSVTSTPVTLAISNAAPSEVGRLVNLSIRSNAGTGSQTLIVGFAVGGAGTSGAIPLLLRGMGPSLAPYGVSDFLPDPVATLYRSTTPLAVNDNWSGSGQVESRRQDVGAFAFASPSSLDAALALSPEPGSYSMQITANGAATGTALAEIYDATPTGAFTAASTRLTNVSARTQVGTGDAILIAGLVIRGSTAKTVLIRGLGPALVPFGVTDTLADPRLRLTPLGSGTTIAENDNWGGDPQIVATATSVGAFPLVNGGSNDAALLVTLPPGSYSALLSGAYNGTGVGMIEVYEVP